MDVVNEVPLGGHKTQRRAEQRRPQAAKPCGRGYPREECDEGQFVVKYGIERRTRQQRQRDAADGGAIPQCRGPSGE